MTDQPKPPETSEPEKLVRVMTMTGLKTELGSMVHIGEDDTGVYIRFTDPQGKQTPLCLSRQAMEGLCELWTQMRLRNIK